MKHSVTIVNLRGVSGYHSQAVIKPQKFVKGCMGPPVGALLYSANC